MIVHELVGSEQNPIYQQLEADNGIRQYDFIRSIVTAALALDRAHLSIEVIKALNYHAISCLHVSAGEFRPCVVSVGTHTPVEFWQVPSHMQMFVDDVNRSWSTTDPLATATYILWKLNHVHPFINGNGRTARATAYFALCLKAGGWLPGGPILPELLRQNRPEYVAALQHADAKAGQADYLAPLHDLVSRLLGEQLASAQASAS